MGEEAKQEQAKPEEKVAAAAAAEEKKEEKAVVAEEEMKKEEEEPKPPSPCILHVDLHCVGCAKKIEKYILKIRGVEGVVMDMGKNEVTVKGIVEPQAVCNIITKKTKRKAKLLSPLPPAEGEGQPLPQVVSSQVSGPTTVTVELDVNMHCEACAEQLKRKILKMRGVQSATTELAAGKVTVTGTMDPDKLVEYVYRRTKKQARIVPQPEPEPEKKEEPKEEGEKPAEADPPAEEKKEEEKPPTDQEDEKKGQAGETTGDQSGEEEVVDDVMMMMSSEEENMKRMMYYYQPLYVIEKMPPAPQLFSDENPNACCIT